MKQRLWLTLITYLAYCIDRELYKAIDYLKEQVRGLQEQQEEDKHILLNNYQRTRHLRLVVFLRPRLRLDLRNTTRPSDPTKSHQDWTRNGEQVTFGHTVSQTGPVFRERPKVVGL